MPELASEWHPEKNGNLTPEKVSKASRRKVWWLGKCGHEWQSIVNDRTRNLRKDDKERKVPTAPIVAGKRNYDSLIFLKDACYYHPQRL